MRLVIRAEFRSVTWAGSMVTGSARSPITMASLGGAAPAPEARATARITRDSVAIRRIVMGGLLWPAILPQPVQWCNDPSPPEGERVALRGERLASSGEARAGMKRGVQARTRGTRRR